MIRWPKSLLRVIAVNIGLLVAAVVIAEAMFGTWLFGTSFGVLNMPRDIARSFDLRLIRPGAAPTFYSRDRVGLRGRYESPAAIDILAIGGSTTNELYISDDETWTARLAQRFAAAGRPLSVVNAGIDGQSTFGNIRNFDLWFPLIPELRARYMLAYIGINDMTLSLGGDNAFQDGYDRIQNPDRNRRLRQYIRNHSALYRMYRVIRGMRLAANADMAYLRVDWAAVGWIEAPGSLARPAWDASQLALGLAAYERRVTELIRRIRAFGSEAIIVTQQKGYWRRQGGKLWVAAGADGAPLATDFAELAAFNQAAMNACRAARAICLDLALEIEFREGDFYDHLHTSPAGSARIADYLYAKLKDRVR